ncbi:predicted protein [Naegleria gruberi]|uniref:Predicted protein n=1 Tax=Naegleria gruberi TaxID=5762 RepID=D2VDP6_NAEGR|nr:uncharacterized protein NAEGRDRAFT_48707 [Naegleria gruberi]EFC44933.1 predicted protein [Naegleria gruberi]|eukprot:XP_002677677.1 predicted protein [Naegleria gruberi strain NEG-M]
MLTSSLVFGFRNMIQFPKQQKKRKELNRKATVGNLNSDKGDMRNVSANSFVFESEMISLGREEQEPNTFEQLGSIGLNILKKTEEKPSTTSSINQPIQVEISRNLSSSSVMNSSMKNLKTINTTPVSSPNFWSLYTPLIILITILLILSLICICIVTAISIYQVDYLTQNIQTFNLDNSHPEWTNTRTMTESYGSTKTYTETLIQLTSSQQSKALYGLYSANSTLRILLFKNQSLYDEFDTSNSINYYSSDVKEINKTKQGVILNSWKLWNGNSDSSSQQTFHLLIQVENSSSAYEAIFHLIVEDENYSNASNFLVFVWILILEILVCLIVSNQIYLSMISYDPTNKQLFISEWTSPFTFFSCKKESESEISSKKDVTIEFKNLSFHSFEGKRILNNISGRIESGKLTAVMGSTGSGKSSFLTVLSKRAHYGVQEGEIKLNGRILTESLKKAIGFVPQDDIMISSLQIWETLMFSSIYRSMTSLFFPLFRKVKETAEMLNIRHKLFSTIGDVNKKVLSGGEKKRLNVGIEIINECQVLLLDEPTSGLDSKQALLLCKILAQKTKNEGLNVICVIHQPSAEIYEMFDDLILFRNGEMIAHGDAKQIASKCAKDILQISDNFEKQDESEGKESEEYNNPGDCVIAAMDIMTAEQQQELIRIQPSLSKFKLDKGGYQNEMSNFIPVPNVPFYIQGLAFLFRGVLQIFHEFSSFATDLLINTISGIFIGAIFVGSLNYNGQSTEEIAKKCPTYLYSTCSQAQEDDISAFISILVLSISLSSILSSLSIFGRDKVVFRRESQSGLNSLVYFLVKDVMAFIPISLASFFFTISSYYLASPKGSLVDYFKLNFLITATTYPIGYIISIAMRTEISQIASGLVVFVVYLFSGVTPTIPEISSFYFPYSWLPHFSFLRYANEILYLNELKNYSSYGKSVESKGYIMEMIDVNMMFMVSFAFFFHILAAVVLWQSVPGSYVSIWTSLIKSKVTLFIQTIRNLKNKTSKNS